MFLMLEKVAGSRYFNKATSPFSFHLYKAHSKLCIITGPNASGKSLLRKILQNYHHDDHIEFINSSQADRCAADSSLIKRAMIYGHEQDYSTGFNSARLIKKFVQIASSRSTSFSLMIDEPEIGCSDELQDAIGRYLSNFSLDNDNLHGVFIITHSRFIVTNLLHLNPSHICLSEHYQSLDEWVNRKIEQVDLDDVIETGKKNWSAVQSLLNQAKKESN